MDNEILVVVNGNEYKKFKSVSISDSMDAIAKGFSLVIARIDFDSGFQINDEVKIYVNTYLQLTGRVNSINVGYSVDSHDISVSGYSTTFDLTKATIYANPNYSTPISFESLAKKVLVDNGITSIKVNSGFAAATQISSIVDDEESGTSGDIGETIFSFLDRYAKKVGVILSTNDIGELLIYKNEPRKTDIKISNRLGGFGNNLILSASYSIDYSKRFNKVIFRSQDEDQELVEASAQDASVKSEGTMAIISENINDKAGCQIQADWEVNKRRTDSINYDCEVFGFAFNFKTSTDSIVWEKNILIDVDDDFAGIKSMMMVKAVSFKFSEGSGSTTTLKLTLADSYSDQTASTNPTNSVTGDLSRYDKIFNKS